MTETKNHILDLQSSIVDTLLSNRSLGLHYRMGKVQALLSTAIKGAKNNGDGLTQLYCCMVDAYTNGYTGAQKGLVSKIKSLTDTKTRFILAKEQGVRTPRNAITLDPDTYGFYYALNDHCSKLWNGDQYELGKNGEIGNPLATHLIEMFYKNEHGRLQYDQFGKQTRDYNNSLEIQTQDKLLWAFSKYKTKVFPDITMAFVGYHSIPYGQIIFPLDQQFGKTGNAHFSPSMLEATGKKLTLHTAQNCIQDHGHISYVITSNVLNSPACYGVTGSMRPIIIGSCAELAKEGGMTIHVMEKPAHTSHLNVIFSQPLYQAIGQDLVYSFFRKKNEHDIENDTDFRKMRREEEPLNRMKNEIREHVSSRLNTESQDAVDYVANRIIQMELPEMKAAQKEELREAKGATFSGNNPEYATSLMVMYQKEKPDITSDTLKKVSFQTRNYEDGPYYTTPQYVSKPGVI